MSSAKDVEVKARVAAETRAKLQAIANQKGETLSLVVREAINEYLARQAKEEIQIREILIPPGMVPPGRVKRRAGDK